MLKLEAPHDNTTLQVLIDAYTAINYHNQEIKPHLSKMEAWEAKEYNQIHEDNINTHKEASGKIAVSQWVFGEALHQYNYTVKQFLNEYSI